MLEKLNLPSRTIKKIQEKSYAVVNKQLDLIAKIWNEIQKASETTSNPELRKSYINLEVTGKRLGVSGKTISRYVKLIESDDYLIKCIETYNGEKRNIGNSLFVIINYQKKPISSTLREKASLLRKCFPELEEK